MESPLLQRIVGAAVLVALGVIFIPVLLDGSGYKSRQLSELEIQQKPDFPPLRKNTVPSIKSPLRESSKSSSKSSGKSVATSKNTETKASASHRKDHSKKAIRAFALQLGTFENIDNAEKLRNKLQKAGYASFVVPVVERKKNRYKVRVGPELEKKQLLKIKEKIKKAYKLDGYVVNHP